MSSSRALKSRRPNVAELNQLRARVVELSFDSESDDPPAQFIAAAYAYEDAYEAASAWTRFRHAWSQVLS